MRIIKILSFTKHFRKGQLFYLFYHNFHNSEQELLPAPYCSCATGARPLWCTFQPYFTSALVARFRMKFQMKSRSSGGT